ncbi:MAG TPA: LLM class flavin-dependent oxidoreductase [Gemmatimonas aurantiaca]|uniref:Alkanesulfonate monooxygenase n=2 Tax=Gemmatimonas aurantiaca TaxID=173480 RepID=C1A9Z9_GEMAT|nr:LLM class flavin-dependent oxidoreductase [Gemmatimonas aurantiaca]BAH39597.1 alkanesulfonate monooxygenase [Gemmatimonas aurantiaca T-27]HCT58393.1 LLM class flavin-dependent oxidoreductase [Gemmatimonas aurantiaca]
MRFGYWLPVFGGWLRNVPDEGMDASWAYVQRLARRSEEIGFDLTLIAELFLNDIKGIEAPALDAWSTAAALAAVTQRLELMVAVRPTFHHPATLAKQAANIDRISNGRLSLNVVSSWWKDEARRYGTQFDQHDDRYARTAEWLDVLHGAWSQKALSYQGKYYQVEDLIVEPKPVASRSRPHPVLYAGGESDAAKTLITGACDAYVMHGDPAERIAPKVADMRARRERTGQRPMLHGMAAYVIVRDTEAEAQRELERITNVAPGSPGFGNYQDWIANTQLDQQVSLQDYSVSNRSLRAGLVGTPEQVADRIRAFQQVGVDLLLLQCSPQLEEMERFAEQVIPLVNGVRSVAA